MPKFNTKFDLNIDDLLMIETALRMAMKTPDQTKIDPKAADKLLGRLHNQKIFYRPKDRVYVSG